MGKKDQKDHFDTLKARKFQKFEKKLICFVQVSVLMEVVKKICVDISELEQQMEQG